MIVYEFTARIEIAQNDIDALRHMRDTGRAIPADSLVRLSQAGLVYRAHPTDVGNCLCCALENGLRPWKCQHVEQAEHSALDALLEQSRQAIARQMAESPD